MVRCVTAVYERSKAWWDVGDTHEIGFTAVRRAIPYQRTEAMRADWHRCGIGPRAVQCGVRGGPPLTGFGKLFPTLPFPNHKNTAFQYMATGRTSAQRAWPTFPKQGAWRARAQHAAPTKRVVACSRHLKWTKHICANPRTRGRPSTGHAPSAAPPPPPPPPPLPQQLTSPHPQTKLPPAHPPRRRASLAAPLPPPPPQLLSLLRPPARSPHASPARSRPQPKRPSASLPSPPSAPAAAFFAAFSACSAASAATRRAAYPSSYAIFTLLPNVPALDGRHFLAVLLNL